jgi:hypothetical protein
MFKALLRRIAQELSKAGLPYMIIGGQAVLLYGNPRLTLDIDITLGAGVDHLEKTLAAVESIGLNVLPDDVESFVQETFVLPARDENSGIRVDLIFSFTPYEKQAIKRANPVYFDDTAVMFASLEDVVIHKIFAGRPRDLEDAEGLLVKNQNADRDYIAKWLAEFDRAMGTTEFTARFAEICRNTV